MQIKDLKTIKDSNDPTKLKDFLIERKILKI
jgi:hypothetical protein